MLKKHFDNIKSLLQEKVNKTNFSFSFDKFLRFLSSWWHFLLAGFVLFVALYYPLGGWFVHHIDKNTEYEIKLADSKQSATVDMASYIINREVNKKLWTANSPFFYPSYFLDNMPSFQLGMMNATSLVINSLQKRIDTPIQNKNENTNLKKAADLLKYDGTVWMFSPQNRFAPVPSANTQYRKARKSLLAYNQALIKDEQFFYKRPEDLAFVLKKINLSLGASIQELDNQIREESAGWIDFKADNLFYYNQGKAYAYFLLLQALAYDYKDILVQYDAYVAWTKSLKALENAVNLDALYIRNAELNGLISANHLLYLAYYMEKAKSLNKNIVLKLQTKRGKNAH